MTAKDLLNKVKALFAEPIPPAAPASPAEPATPTGVDCVLEDGRMLHCEPDMSVGAKASIDGQPAPAGDYKMQDGSSCTVGADGAITDVKSAEPVTTPPAPPMFSEAKTPEELKAMMDAFATGTPEERITKLETVARALMEYSFGWQIREAQTKALNDQAIAIYKQGLSAAEEKLSEAEKKIEKQDKVIEGLFELAEKLAETPTTEPKTLTGNKKEQFERTEKKEKRLAGIAAAIKDIKVNN